MGFLSEAITSMDLAGVSPFTESIILATICGRTLSHRQQSVVEHVYNHVPQHFWERHEWLYAMLKTRCDNFVLQYPSAVQHTNCMLLFTNMMAQTTVLYLCRVLESITWVTDEYRSAIADFKQTSLLAAKEIVSLTRSLPHLSYFKVISTISIALSSLFALPLLFSFFFFFLFSAPFRVQVPKLSHEPPSKVHPFTPLPLALCVDFFNTHRYLDESVDLQVEEILEVLRDLTNVNNLAQDYLS